MSASQSSKLAIITGGAQGIGLGIVRHLVERSWRVAALDLDQEALDELLSHFDHDDSRILTCRADVGKESDVNAAFDAIKHWQEKHQQAPGIDLLVNNAGIANPVSGPIEDLALYKWQRWIDSHLTGTFLCTRAAVSGLRIRKGSLINMASTRAFQSEPDCEAYAAAKGAVVAMAHALSISLGPDVRANVICPGWIETAQYKKKSEREQPVHREIDVNQHPAGRIGEPADIASMVEYLTTPHASFITGQTFIIDGGMSRKLGYAE